MQDNSGTFLGTTQSGFNFDAETERGAISSAHIRNLTAEKITSGTINGTVIYGGTITGDQINGGTLTLGGTLNGDGVMQIKNASGTAIIRGDNTGHHYYNTGGTELVRVNDSGLHAYTGGTEYIKLDSTGLHGYNEAGTELIKVDQVGFHAYGTTGVEQLRIAGTGLFAYGSAQEVFQFRDDTASTIQYGALGFSTLHSAFFISTPTNRKIFLSSGSALIVGVSGTTHISSSDNLNLVSTGGTIGLVADEDIILLSENGDIALSYDGDFSLNGTVKTAVVPTSQGYRALYTNESPDVWFVDFARGTLESDLDPMFRETTSPPYHYIQCVGGEYQVWGKRKGFEHTRFGSKTKEEFERNNKFWGQE